jgi:excisionase family DNA binding protein
MTTLSSPGRTLTLSEIRERAVLTASEVALILGTTAPTVYDMIKAGTLEAITIGTGRAKPAIRVPGRAVLAYLGEPERVP